MLPCSQTDTGSRPVSQRGRNHYTEAAYPISLWVSAPVLLALQTSSYRSDLEASKAELAATNVKLSSITSQLDGLRSSLATKDAEIHQLKVSKGHKKLAGLNAIMHVEHVL